MSVVTVQLGQCGNQVGQELYDVICCDAQQGQRKPYCKASCERFFRQNTRGGKVVHIVVKLLKNKTFVFVL